MFWVHLFARLVLLVFCILSWTYGIASYSPFAFDMFIRPGLLPAVSSFVAWHHLWYWAAYLAAAISLAVDIGSAGKRRVHPGARWLACTFIIVFGVIGTRLVSEPYLPTLVNDARSLGFALACLLPLVWVAAIDHLIGWPSLNAAGDADVTPPERLLFACAATGGFVWLAHMLHLHMVVRSPAPAWLIGDLWALALCAVTFMLVYVLLSLAVAIAAATRSPRLWEYCLSAGILAASIGEWLRRIVLRALSVTEPVAIPVAVLTGVALAALWSGLALRRSATERAASRTGLDLLLALGPRRVPGTAGALVLLGLLGYTILVRLERLDWNFVLQKTAVLSSWTLAFGMFIRASERIRPRPWSARALAIPPVAALVALYGIPHAAAVLSGTNIGRSVIASALERDATNDIVIGLQSSAFIEQPGLDPQQDRYLQLTAASTINGSRSVPHVEFSASETPSGPRPHIFLFVIDSLRRDYLSIYNPEVTFTPQLERFGRDSFVFTNAFTQYGGTWLSMPALWAGGPVARGWGGASFDRVNAIEQLIVKDRYRLIINDFTVSGYLMKSTPRTFLQPDVPSVDTDLCTLLTELEAQLEATASGNHPVLAYLAPMNVHLLNTRSGQTLSPGERYPGFYAPYASRLRRLDACFGEFIAFLKRRDLYDESIIVVTSDHGDSLGENGQWGHQFGLFPEHVRVPLLMRVPDSVRSTVTTDLSRISFLTDLAPTLYSLLGHEIRDPGRLFGSPLVVPRDRELPPRRRDSFLLMSSYGPTYGLLRRNGRLLYVVDIAEGRDYAFDLSRSPRGVRTEVTPDLRQVNRQLIRQLVEEVNAFYGIRPSS
jgi:sulfatase-like protein